MSFSAKTNAKWNKKETPSKLTHSYEVTVPYQTFVDWGNENRSQKTVKGFRPGHAPLSYFKDDWVMACARLIADELISKEKYENVYDVKYILKTFELGKDVMFTLNIELYPEVPKIDLTSINLTKHTAKISKENIATAIKRFASINTKPVDLEKARPTQMGDYINVSVEVKDSQGKTEKMNEMDIQLGKKTFLPEIEEKLVGLNIKDELKHSFTIPETGTMLKDNSLVGNQIELKFQINKIQAAKELDEKDMLEYFSVGSKADLEKTFEENIAQEAKHHSNHLLKESLKQELLKHQFEIPMDMVQRRYVNLRQQMFADLGLTGQEGKEDLEKALKEKMNLSLDDFENRSVFIAEAMARISFLMMHFGHEMKIQVTKEELENAIASQKNAFPNGLNEAVQFFEDNPEAKNNLRNTILEDKVAKALVAKTKVTEKEHTLEDFYKITLAPEVVQNEIDSTKSVEDKKEAKKSATKAEKNTTEKGE